MLFCVDPKLAQNLYFTLEQMQVKFIRKIPQVNPSFGQKSQNISKVVVFIFENPGCGLWCITSKPGFKVHTKHVVMSIFTRAQWKSVQRLGLDGVRMGGDVSYPISLERCQAQTVTSILTIIVPKVAVYCLVVHLNAWEGHLTQNITFCVTCLVISKTVLWVFADAK